MTTAPPLVFKNGSASNAVLDCEYALNDEEYATNEKNPGALVVKWFFNNDPAPVYQWIHSKKPQGLGVLNGKLNLEYRISDDNATMYRALQIINPTTELSGEYKCTVSTFNDERSQTRKMIIYGKLVFCISDKALLTRPYGTGHRYRNVFIHRQQKQVLRMALMLWSRVPAPPPSPSSPTKTGSVRLSLVQDCQYRYLCQYNE